MRTNYCLNELFFFFFLTTAPVSSIRTSRHCHNLTWPHCLQVDSKRYNQISLIIQTVASYNERQNSQNCMTSIHNLQVVTNNFQTASNNTSTSFNTQLILPQLFHSWAAEWAQRPTSRSVKTTTPNPPHPSSSPPPPTRKTPWQIPGHAGLKHATTRLNRASNSVRNRAAAGNSSNCCCLVPASPANRRCWSRCGWSTAPGSQTKSWHSIPALSGPMPFRACESSLRRLTAWASGSTHTTRTACSTAIASSWWRRTPCACMRRILLLWKGARARAGKAPSQVWAAAPITGLTLKPPRGRYLSITTFWKITYSSTIGASLTHRLMSLLVAITPDTTVGWRRAAHSCYDYNGKSSYCCCCYCWS